MSPCPEQGPWQEIDAYLQAKGLTISNPTCVQTTGGGHAPGSLHYAKRARDYNGSVSVPIARELEQFARGPNYILQELFYQPTDTWWKRGVRKNVGGHRDHCHAALRLGAHLPRPILEEETMASTAFVATVRPGETGFVPVPPPHAGAGWRGVYWSVGVDFAPQSVRIAYGHPGSWRILPDPTVVPVGRKLGGAFPPGSEGLSLVHRGAADGNPGSDQPVTVLIEAESSGPARDFLSGTDTLIEEAPMIEEGPILEEPQHRVAMTEAPMVESSPSEEMDADHEEESLRTARLESAIVSRAAWGARPPRQRTRIPSPQGVAVHWEGPRMGLFDHERCAGHVRGIQAFHMDTKRWDDLAYSGIVCPHGEVFEGRGPGVRTAANGTNEGNDRYYAVCYLSGEGDPFTDAAKAGINEAIAWLGGGDVRPHSAFKPTACPGDEIRSWIAAGHPSDGPHHPTVHETLRRGARGPVVRHMQELLIAAGHDLSNVGGADANFGPGTEREVRNFQAARGLASDGICGPITWTRLH